MRRREFPVLSEADEPLVERLALGLGDDTARVLGYLLRRRTDPEVGDGPANRLAIRVGTGLNRTAVSDALGRLERRELVTKTTVETDQGRPPAAWFARDDVDTTLERVDATHAVRLLEQAVAVADELGTTEPLVSPGPSTADVSSAPASTPFEVGLNWFANTLHAPLFAARATGAYERRGLDVAIQAFTGSDRAVEAVDEGTVDVAVSGAATVVRARAAGVPVVPLAPLYQRSMTVLYTTEAAFGGRLDGIEAVRGRRVGMPVGAETGLLGRLFLSQSGVIDDVTVVDLSGEEESDALATGRADVVSGSIGDVRDLEAAGHTVDVLSVDGHFPIYGPTLVTAEDAIREQSAELMGFLAGTVAGWRVAAFEPATAIQAVASATAGGTEPAEPDETVEEAVTELERTLERFGTSGDVADHGWGWHDAAGWQRLSTALGQVGLLDNTANTEEPG